MYIIIFNILIIKYIYNIDITIEILDEKKDFVKKIIRTKYES